MSRPSKLVSICVPTRNRADSLRESLVSICGQDYDSLDIVVSDNGSDDHTEAVVRDFERRDSRVRYIRHDRNIGLHANHNFCFDTARGEFICIWHDHDEREASTVSDYVAFLDQHPKVGVVCSDWDLINDRGEQIGVREHEVAAVTAGLDYIAQTIRSGRSSIGIPGAMVRASALGRARFDPDAPIGFGDFPVWCRVAETWDIGHIHRRLWRWRQNAQSHSARTIESIARDYDQNISAYCDAHIERWPGHRSLVAKWRVSLKRYLFWALAYEIGLSFRPAPRGDRSVDSPSVFEIMDYRLTPPQFESALSQMRSYRTGFSEYAAYAAVAALVRTGLTHPLAWAAAHREMMRTLLNLR